MSGCLSVLSISALLVALWQRADADVNTFQAQPAEEAASDGEPTDAAIRDGFVVVPIRTELQRVLSDTHKEAKVFVLINGMDAIRDEDEILDITKVKLQKILDAIRPYAIEGDPGNVVFRVIYRRDGNAGRIGPSPFAEVGLLPASHVLNRALHQLGRDTGFKEVRVEEVFLMPDAKYANNWSGAVRDVLEHPGDPDVDEKSVGDEQVKLFVVQTGLSRFIHDADLVVYYVPPITDVDVPAALETLRRCIRKIDLPKKDEVEFLFNRGSPRELNSIAVDDLIKDERVFKDILGFKTWSGRPRD